MDQITKITQMENYLNDAQSAICIFSEALEQFEACQARITELSQYYGSEEWFQDLEDHGSGRLPEDLKCGVLSQDLVYDLLMENYALGRRLEELGKSIIKSR